MDAITMLREDHREVKSMFKEFQKAGDPAKRRQIADRIIRELSIHAGVEEQVFYPAIRREMTDLESTVLEGLEEHHIAKVTLSELEGMDPGHPRFEAKVMVLMESVMHHVEEEESELFPAVRKAMGRKMLAELGETMATAKKTAPTRPHPNQPDEPPGNLVGGMVSGVTDRMRDAVGAAAGKATGKAKPAAGKTAGKVKPSSNGSKSTTSAKSSGGRAKAGATR